MKAAGQAFGSESPGPLRGPSQARPARYEKHVRLDPRTEQPRLRNGPQDRRLAQSRRGPLRSPPQARPAHYEKPVHHNPRSEQPRLRNGPQDRRSAQNRRGRCAAHRRQGLLATKSTFASIPVASSLGCVTGRRTVVQLRIAGAAAQPIAACAARYRVRGVAQTAVGVPLACDRRRSRRKPTCAFLPGKTRCLICCRSAPDRTQAVLQGFGADC